jgi:hypothetical protein
VVVCPRCNIVWDAASSPFGTETPIEAAPTTDASSVDLQNLAQLLATVAQLSVAVEALVDVAYKLYPHLANASAQARHAEREDVNAHPEEDCI